MSYTPNFRTPCQQSDFTGTFGTGTTVIDTHSGVNITKASNGGANIVAGLYKTAPGTPYTITVCMEWNGANTNYCENGIGWSDGTQYIIFYMITHQGGTGMPVGQVKLGIAKFTNTTTFNSVYLEEYANIMPGRRNWMRMADDGTNRICSFSKDGNNFFQFHSVGRTDFLTPTRNVLSVNPYDHATNVTFSSWKQT